MKISASIYSSNQKDLPELIKELDDHRVDYFHMDCNDDPQVFEDIEIIQRHSNTPIDLHIISPRPSQYFELLKKHKIDYVSFQYEVLEEELDIPADIAPSLGLAITSDTGNEAFAKFEDKFSFVLMMATTPGKSGGTFDKANFKKIRQFRQMYPGTRIHVDGGVNAEVSFILRNMGVDSSVSGSYLMKHNSIGAALLDLKTHEIDSHYLVKDFMRDKTELPLLKPGRRNFREILQSIEDYNLGFTLLVDEDDKLEGMITNADVRRELLRHIDDLNKAGTPDIINTNPKVAQEDFSVTELLQYIKEQPFAINYIPVVNEKNVVTGGLSFMNLIKGEL